MRKHVDWYFDFISPFAYLQQLRFMEFPADVSIRPIPVLFAALLDHWHSKGPAEIPAKRIFTYQHVSWLAARQGISFTMPPAHPFNPLRALRLSIVMDNDLTVIAEIFKHIWQDGMAIDDDTQFSALLRHLGREDAAEQVKRDEIKQRLHQNTRAAIENEVFGVPTIVANGKLFWGNDASDMYLDYYENPALFDSPAMQGLADLPMTAERAH